MVCTRHSQDFLPRRPQVLQDGQYLVPLCWVTFSVGLYWAISAFPQPKAVAGKGPATKHKFVIDYSKPAGDGVFDGADFEKFLHDRIKVEGKAGHLGENVKITRDGLFVHFVLTFRIVWRSMQAIPRSLCLRISPSQNGTSNISPKSSWRRTAFVTGFGQQNAAYPTFTYLLILFSFILFCSVVASSKDSYQLRFYNIAYVLYPHFLYIAYGSQQWCGWRWWRWVDCFPRLADVFRAPLFDVVMS